MVGDNEIGLIAISHSRTIFYTDPYNSKLKSNLNGLLHALSSTNAEEDRMGPNAYASFIQHAESLYSILLSLHWFELKKK